MEIKPTTNFKTVIYFGTRCIHCGNLNRYLFFLFRVSEGLWAMLLDLFIDGIIFSNHIDDKARLKRYEFRSDYRTLDRLCL